MIYVSQEYQKRGIATAIYQYVRKLGNTIKPSRFQLPAGKSMWKSFDRTDALAESDQPTRIKLGGSDSAARAWIDRVYKLYPQTFQNNHVMPLGGSGDDQEFAMFELVPSLSRRGAVEVKWFQAYPLRQGVGSRAMQQLQQLAREDGISLTLFPWDKGQVSQSKLTKFYRGQGFSPAQKGSKAMQWTPDQPGVAEGLTEYKNIPLEDFGGLQFRIDKKDPYLLINAFVPNSGKEIAQVAFKIFDQNKLDPEDLHVEERFRGQGVAETMYDFVKSKGYEIHRSWSQTDAGAGFWDKHRGQQRVWEQDVEEIGKQGVAESADIQPRAAGCVIVAADTGRWCLQQRSNSVSDPGVWSTWGGGREPGENLQQCVRRELAEESGYQGLTKLELIDTNQDYATFLAHVPREFVPQINHECQDWRWSDPDDLPEPLHPGLQRTLMQLMENFADGKVKGKSRPGRVKRAGASCDGSVTDLRARAKKASGERAKMYHWCANMKSGRNKNK
jgi:8-oxo-dGTP pyrophosphatase MutT (NUDIX family)/GNAT superfamily N-acetyltransferase